MVLLLSTLNGESLSDVIGYHHSIGMGRWNVVEAFPKVLDRGSHAQSFQLSQEGSFLRLQLSYRHRRFPDGIPHSLYQSSIYMFPMGPSICSNR